MQRIMAVLALLLASPAFGATSDTIGINTGAGDYLCTEQQSGCNDEVVRAGPSQVTTKTTNQVTGTGTSNAIAIFSGATPCWGVSIKAKPANTAAVYVIYDSALAYTSGFELYPGDVHTFAAPNTGNCASLWIKAASGNAVSVVTQ